MGWTFNIVGFNLDSLVPSSSLVGVLNEIQKPNVEVCGLNGEVLPCPEKHLGVDKLSDVQALNPNNYTSIDSIDPK